MAIETLVIPDIGGAEQVEIIEILVSVGDSVEAEEGLIVLETDKASMEIPAPSAGTIKSLSLKVGDKINEGESFGEIETGAASQEAAPAAEATPVATAVDSAPVASVEAAAPAASSEPVLETIMVPDLGGAEQAELIELLVKVGETIEPEQSVFTLETDKASMEIPAGCTGTVQKVLLALGDKVSAGHAMLEVLVQADTSAAPVAAASVASEPAAKASAPAPAPVKATTAAPVKAAAPVADVKPSDEVHAGPSVRKTAREFGIDLSLVKGSGTRGRVTKEDVQNYVKDAVTAPQVAGSGIPKVPAVDFSKFGEVEHSPLNKIKLITAKNMTAAWLNIPQVTQFDQADITELEAFRKQMNSAKNCVQKLSAVPFVMKALAQTMKEFPQFNASLSADGSELIFKKYTNIGVAVDTPNGLLVPVVKDIDTKSVNQIAKDLGDLAGKARDGKLGLADMQGGCMTVSSLGGIGGTAFTPIVNAPEVAILGLSRAEMKPVWNGSEFTPRLMLPIALTYDHRVIDGAEAARFSQRLSALLGDIRHLVL